MSTGAEGPGRYSDETAESLGLRDLKFEIVEKARDSIDNPDTFERMVFATPEEVFELFDAYVESEARAETAERERDVAQSQREANREWAEREQARVAELERGLKMIRDRERNVETWMANAILLGMDPTP